MVTEPSEHSWTAKQVLEVLSRRIDDMAIMLEERYKSQTTAVNAAFVAEQSARANALIAAKEAVQLAQQAAKEATAKAEESADKRFNALVSKMDEDSARFTEQISAIRSSLDLGQGKYLAVAGLASVMAGSAVAIIMQILS